MQKHFPQTRGPDANQLREAILRLCLDTSGAQPDRLRAAFEILAASMERKSDRAMFVPHPALLVRGLRANRLALPTGSQRRLEAAALREERRSSIAAAQADQLGDFLDRNGIQLHPLRGWHLAKRYYPDPLARHCHALRWFAPGEATLDRLISLFAQEGWDTALSSPLLAPHKIVLAGKDRINVELHRQIFPWTERVPHCLAQEGPEFAAVELIGSAIIEPQAKAGLWLVDLVQLLRNERIDVVRFAEMAADYGIAATAHRSLDLVADLITSETAVHDQIELLRGALSANGGIPPRDGRAVSDLLIIQSMAVSSRARLLLKGVMRPDLIARGYALRIDGAGRRRKLAESRQRLRDHHIVHRKSGRGSLPE